MKRCPGCGRPMSAIKLPQTPPWICRPCGHAFWECELTEEARAAYRAQHRDWGAEIGLRRRLAEARRIEARL